ncbi:MAG: arsenite methyltransferase [Chloroflexi bacterium]|nr:arsenite methyltransferase [Chloroflexota bacterium]
MTQNPTPIHESVREHYAAQARASQPCCGDSSSCCDSKNALYPVELLTNLPDDVASFSLGCGNPFAEAGLKPGETVLDLGSGGGLDCFLAAKQVGESGHVIGVDMTPEMLERARLAASRLGVRNVEFREGYLEKLPVEDASVDVVISNCVINLSPDKPQVFREVFRVLRSPDPVSGKPGGRLAVSDIVTDGPLPEELQKNMEAWGACVAGALDVSEYITGLADAGFTDVKVQPKGDASELIEAAGLKGKIFSAAITARRPL